MLGMSGIECLRQLKRSLPDVNVIMLGFTKIKTHYLNHCEPGR
ncbi:MAG: hypothetical protein M2R45_02563 [Verrucomicrobia subdivision 3 bacterium]|nr:hypothetical protein [Limisphaerales bacterium]MCS1414230.1 hypothetical protein [Limisphaerales bacterium]